MKKTEIIKDIATGMLEGMILGQIVGIAVSIDDESGEKYYGLRINKVFPGRPQDMEIYVIWFLRDSDGSGPGFFQIQQLNKK
jgi:hypothetical protein